MDKKQMKQNQRVFRRLTRGKDFSIYQREIIEKGIENGICKSKI